MVGHGNGQGGRPFEGLAEGSGKQGVAKRTRAKRGEGSGRVCLQS